MPRKKLTQKKGRDRRARSGTREQNSSEEIRLSELRKRLGLKQAKVAQAMGVSQSSVSQLESQDDMQVSSLRKYARALGGQIRVTIELPEGSFALGQAKSEKPTAMPRFIASIETLGVVRVNHFLREQHLNELKELIVQFEMLGEGLDEIVRLYHRQRSEEVIEDMEAEIEKSF